MNQAETFEWMRRRIETLEAAASSALEWFAAFGNDCGTDFMKQTASENYERLDALLHFKECCVSCGKSLVSGCDCGARTIGPVDHTYRYEQRNQNRENDNDISKISGRRSDDRSSELAD